MKHTPSTVNEVFCGVGIYCKYWGIDHEIWYLTGILWIPCVFLFGCSALFGPELPTATKIAVWKALEDN